MISFLAEVDRLGDVLRNAPAGNFSTAAFSHLRAVPFHTLFSQDLLPELRKRDSETAHLLEHDCVFSDECLILYVTEHFTIELYHWLYSDTGIHDHNFQGAFQCLEGEDHQIEFQFVPEREIFDGLEQGKLLEVSNSLIAPGMTQEIRNNDHFIHAVAHAPSTYNLCIRTRADKTQILKAYHTDGFRYALRRDHEEKLRAMELSEMNFQTMDSGDLLHLFHMLGGKTGHHEYQKRIDLIFQERHGISYLGLTAKTHEFLDQMGRMAKNY